MKRYPLLLLALLLTVYGGVALAANNPAAKSAAAPSVAAPEATQSVTQGSVTIAGKKIDYTATAGTIILKNEKDEPTGSMFYVAYVKKGVKSGEPRPVTFFYNGGPGSSTMWLHMGSFGPVRVVVNDHTHTPAAPYGLVSNEYSLLDVTDEVFIDAMGTGYSRILGKDQGGVGTREDFYGIDPDIKAFSQFIKRYLSENGRWNSPKYIYGESYGTIRSMGLVNYLAARDDIDLNGVVIQSATTGFGMLTFDPNHDLNYALFLPGYTATAWYHHKLPNQPAALQPLLKEAEHFALNDYAAALNAGSALSPDQFKAMAEKLHQYTGLDTAYIEKANLRVGAREFFHELLADQGNTVGRLDSRFVGPSMDPLGQGAMYDPQSAAISAAYVSTFNDYVHNVLKYGQGQMYLPSGDVRPWNGTHIDPMTRQPQGGYYDVGVDLAQALKRNPNLRVLLSSGYYDLATPYFGIDYSMDHLGVSADLRSHIQTKYYEAGHMMYVNIPALQQLRDNTVAFIQSTENLR